MKRVDLANWALRTSPKFTTGIKYQFHQGFWPDQRSQSPFAPYPNVIPQIILKSLEPFVHRCEACGSIRACQAAGPGSIPGRDKFPGWSFFRDLFLTCKTTVRKLSAHTVPRISFGHHNHPYHIRLVRMNECCLGGGPGIELITHLRRPSMSLCGHKSMYVIQS